jgi:tetratricopeptide (TPR) repeat protein
MAMYYVVSAGFGALPPRSALPQADDLVAKGLALHANAVMLYSILGILRMYEWRWTESEDAHRRAMNLEPSNAFPHMMYPILCSVLGRHDEAVTNAAKAVELDPLDLMTNFRLVQVNYYARRYHEAVRTGRIAVELTPDSPYTFFYLALALAATGLHNEAWSAAKQGKQLNEGLPLGEGYFGYLAGVLGHTVEARSLATELQARRQISYVPALPIAWTYLGLGETAEALDWMETALAEREPFLAFLMVFPGYDSIRDEARFRRIVQQLKFST